MLSRLSRATPEIANYPFTTKHPNLGIVSLGGDASFVMADLPGLIEGASQGVGLGHEFLRHVERTRVLIHLVEPFPMDESDPVQNYRIIRNELSTYSPELATKPEILCVSKAELTDADQVRDRLAAELGQEVFLVSSVTGLSLNKVVGRAWELIQELRRTEREEKAKAQPVEFSSEKAIRTTDVPVEPVE
jgi:GTP-binding protein